VVWNPSRLVLDGEEAPVHEPIGGSDQDNSGKGGDLSGRHAARLRFWSQLLDHAKQRSDLFARISPAKGNWIWARRDGAAWTYAVKEDRASAVIVFDSPHGEENKALFDALYARKESVEADFGAPLRWLRLDDKKSCWIAVDFPGGWRDEDTWPQVIEQVVETMRRLYAVFAPHVRDIRGKE
jgi:hypothetical protein